MPSKKKKYNARFPPARIKKIMQTDEEIGKVAAAVPVIISRALELFLESLLTKACHVTQSRNAKTMTTSHLGRKPGSGRKNGGAGSKGKDKKLSGTESEQEEDSEDSETDGDEDDGSQSSTNQQAASMFHSSNAPSQVVHMGNMVSAATLPPAQALGTIAFAPHPSMVSIAPPPPAPAPHKNEEEDDDDEDYDS
ncbi:dr1-associated corepressor isoform X4 [Fundulus heteroclitus]|uniref:dr1-associated corepressor isoform X4 n=1 Tax=Fundulus heteroclitus TaxID=8078 RepID=UPI00165CDF2D|nr:dr1-associated corepressor isoform X4 [Fundulus heteroclitus]